MNYGVVIPSTGRKEFLKEAIESALAQSVKPIACVVVMDAPEHHFSTLKSRYLNQVIFVPSESKSANNCRKQGAAHLVQKVGVDAVAFLDDDDKWLPTKSEKQLRLVKERNLQTFAVGCKWSLLKNRQVEDTCTPPAIDIHKQIQFYQALGSFSSIIVSADIAMDIAPDIPSCQDWHYLLSLSLKGVPILRVEEALLLYRMHSGLRISGSLDRRLNGLRMMESTFSKDIDFHAKRFLQAQIAIFTGAVERKYSNICLLPISITKGLSGRALRTFRLRILLALCIEAYLGAGSLEFYRSCVKRLSARSKIKSHSSRA